MKYFWLLSFLSILVICKVQGRHLDKGDSGEIDKHHPDPPIPGSDEDLDHHHHHHHHHEDGDDQTHEDSGSGDKDDEDKDKDASVEVDPEDTDTQEESANAKKLVEEVVPEEISDFESSNVEAPLEPFPEDDFNVDKPVEGAILPDESNSGNSSNSESSNVEVPPEPLPEEIPVEEVAPEDNSNPESSNVEQPVEQENLPSEGSDVESPVEPAAEENSASETSSNTEDQGQPEIPLEDLLGELQIESAPVETEDVEDDTIKNMKVVPYSGNTASAKRETPADLTISVSDDAEKEDKVPLDESGVNSHVGEEGGDPAEEEANLEAEKQVGQQVEEKPNEKETVEEEDSKDDEKEEEDKSSLIKDPEFEIPEDEQFPPEMLPEQPKDVLVKKQTYQDQDNETLVSESKDSEPVISENNGPVQEVVPEVDIDTKTLENFKSASGGIAFDVPLEDSVEEKEKKDGSDTLSDITENNNDGIENDGMIIPIIPESESDVYEKLDERLLEDKFLLLVADPVILEDQPIQENDTQNVEQLDKNLDTAYPSELEDDFNVDHRTGLMPAGNFVD